MNNLYISYIHRSNMEEEQILRKTLIVNGKPIENIELEYTNNSHGRSIKGYINNTSVYVKIPSIQEKQHETRKKRRTKNQSKKIQNKRTTILHAKRKAKINKTRKSPPSH